MQKKLAAAVQILAAVVIIPVLAFLLSVIAEENREKNLYKRLAAGYTRYYPDGTGTGDEQPEDVADFGRIYNKHRRLYVDFDALAEINDEIAGWIYIDGTAVNYPIVQTGDNSYYLHKSFEREQSRLGTLFFDWTSAPDDSDVLIVYGHNMGKGRTEMFSSLSVYDDPDFRGRYEDVLTVTRDGRETLWNVFAVVHINYADYDADMFRVFKFDNEEAYNSYVQLILSKRLYDTGLEPPAGQRLLVLSTCLGSGRNEMRRMIFAYAAE